jgi:hypothetical protein
MVSIVAAVVIVLLVWAGFAGYLAYVGIGVIVLSVAFGIFMDDEGGET